MDSSRPLNVYLLIDVFPIWQIVIQLAVMCVYTRRQVVKSLLPPRIII